MLSILRHAAEAEALADLVERFGFKRPPPPLPSLGAGDGAAPALSPGVSPPAPVAAPVEAEKD